MPIDSGGTMVTVDGGGWAGHAARYGRIDTHTKEASMFRIVVKASNIRQAAASVEAHGNVLLDLMVRIVRHPTFIDEWVADIVARPGDTGIRNLLNAWYCEGLPWTPPFPMGALLYWGEVNSTELSVRVDAEALVSEAIVSGIQPNADDRARFAQYQRENAR